MCIDEDNKFSELVIASNFLFLILELSSSILILSKTNRVIKTSNTLFNPWISISSNGAIIMSNVYTIIIYIVSMYSNIRGYILTLSYSILLFSFRLGNTNRGILWSVFLLQVTEFFSRFWFLLLSLVFCFSIFGVFTFNEFGIVSRFYVCIYR